MLWIPPGMVVSPPGWSGSSRGLPGEFFSSLGSERFLTRFDALRRFFGLFLMSSTFPDACDAFASALVSLSSKLD